MTRQAAHAALLFLLILAIWESVGLLTSFGAAVLPPPTEIAKVFWEERGLYWLHGVATARTAATGFVAGTLTALSAAFLFCLFPKLETLFRGVNIAIFAMPAIVIGPLLVLIFPGQLPQIILAALLVYYPTMTAALFGLREIDPRLIAVIEIYGGRDIALMRFVRIRSALPTIFAGLRTAAPLAVLGAVLGEFGSGAQWGFGTFLLAALPQANPARLWGIGLAGSFIALGGYLFFLLPARRLETAASQVTLAAAQADPSPPMGAHTRSGKALLLAGAALMPFFLWWVALAITQLSPIIAPGPLQTFSYILTAPGAGEARAVLGQALSETLPIAALGFLSGLAAAFLLAALSFLAPAISRALLPAAMLAQNIPLVALVPFVLLLFGRGMMASVFMAVLVVFFPAYVMINQGFRMVPAPARELVAVYGGGRWKQLVLICIPYARASLFAAAKLVAPQALLGVLIAEWLLSGIGLGNLLNASRGTLDYELIWAGALISILISVGAYQLVATFERAYIR
jgi:ABC-type nitrate/sulfonate/bicarbonate transport system permease component